MRPHDGAIRTEPFQVGVSGKMLKELAPNSPLFPAGEPFIDTIPFATGLGQQAPGGTAAGHPEYHFNKAAALEFVPDIQAGTRFQEGIDAFPVVIR